MPRRTRFEIVYSVLSAHENLHYIRIAERGSYAAVASFSILHQQSESYIEDTDVFISVLLSALTDILRYIRAYEQAMLYFMYRVIRNHYNSVVVKCDEDDEEEKNKEKE